MTREQLSFADLLSWCKVLEGHKEWISGKPYGQGRRKREVFEFEEMEEFKQQGKMVAEFLTQVGLEEELGSDAKLMNELSPEERRREVERRYLESKQRSKVVNPMYTLDEFGLNLKGTVPMFLNERTL